MENPIKMDDLGVPLFFGNTHINPKHSGLGECVLFPRQNPWILWRFDAWKQFQTYSPKWWFDSDLPW